MTAVALSVVVPVYNNAATLDDLIDRLHQVMGGLGVSYELVFVDDGSEDESFRILCRRAREDARLRAFALTRNFGSQAALCAGFDLVRGERTVCIDADLENLPEDIPRLLSALEAGADLACGVRQDRGGSFLGRRVPSALFNAFVRHRIGRGVEDIGCGMRAMDSRLVHNLAAEGEARRLITPLLLRRARKVVEVPIRTGRTPPRHGHTFLTLLGIAADFYLFSARRPFLLFGGISVFAGVAGTILIVAAAVGLVRAGVQSGILLLGLGLLGCAVSLAGDYAQRIYQLSQGIPFYELRDEATGSDLPRSSTEP